MEQRGEFSLCGNLYCLLPHPIAKFPRHHQSILHGLDYELLPCTVITWTKACFTDLDLDTISKRFSNEDDVWCPGFLQGELNDPPQSRKFP